MTIQVQTTFFPGKVMTIDDSEYLDLKRQGLIIEGSESTADQGPTTGAEVVADLNAVDDGTE